MRFHCSVCCRTPRQDPWSSFVDAWQSIGARHWFDTRFYDAALAARSKP